MLALALLLVTTFCSALFVYTLTLEGFTAEMLRSAALLGVLYAGIPAFAYARDHRAALWASAAQGTANFGAFSSAHFVLPAVLGFRRAQEWSGIFNRTVLRPTLRFLVLSAGAARSSLIFFARVLRAVLRGLGTLIGRIFFLVTLPLRIVLRAVLRGLGIFLAGTFFIFYLPFHAAARESVRILAVITPVLESQLRRVLMVLARVGKQTGAWGGSLAGRVLGKIAIALVVFLATAIPVGLRLVRTASRTASRSMHGIGAAWWSLSGWLGPRLVLAWNGLTNAMRIVAQGIGWGTHRILQLAAVLLRDVSSVLVRVTKPIVSLAAVSIRGVSRVVLSGVRKIYLMLGHLFAQIRRRIAFVVRALVLIILFLFKILFRLAVFILRPLKVMAAGIGMFLSHLLRGIATQLAQLVNAMAQSIGAVMSRVFLGIAAQSALLVQVIARTIEVVRLRFPRGIAAQNARSGAWFRVRVYAGLRASGIQKFTQGKFNLAIGQGVKMKLNTWSIRLYRRLGFSGAVFSLVTVFAVAGLLFVTACAPAKFRILAGSGHTSFEPILKRFGQQNNVDIEIKYMGSLDIMQMLEAAKIPGDSSGKIEYDANGILAYDAIWDGDSLWTTMGDKQHLIKNRESIMRSPVVFGVKKPLAEKLGWTAGNEVSVQEILQGIEKENLRVMMTSATQSNSGASAYLGFLYAFANPQGALTADDLQKPDVQASVKKLLSSIDRTSESSGFLRDLFPDVYDSFDAMFNYESHIMELNKKLVAKNLEPLYLVYPAPGLGIADFPLSYVDHRDAQKEKIFNNLQTYLLSDSVQQEIAAKCRRVGKVGVDQVDVNCFVPAWSADVTHGTTPMRLPDTSVVRQALDLYQTALRKPSFTVYALDFSGSMQGDGEKQLNQAMGILLDQQNAGKYFLQGSPDDVTMVIMFDHEITNDADLSSYAVKGSDSQALNNLLGKIQRQQTGGNTNIYLPAARALEYMKQEGIGERLPAVILMTDGKSNSGSIQELTNAIASTGLENVPVYAITFGQADPNQLQVIADLTHGRVFDGKTDLIGAFRKAKGNN